MPLWPALAWATPYGAASASRCTSRLADPTSTSPIRRRICGFPEILNQFPHFPILLRSIETAKPHPKVVQYGGTASSFLITDHIAEGAITLSSSSFNIGVLGAGQIAQAAHFPAVRKAKTAQLYAICDAADDLRERMAAVHQPTTTFADYDTMLADDNIDAVIVAVADQFHVPLAIRALNAGKHVLVEKPMATTVEDAEALVEAARTSGRVVLVGHEKRYDPGVAFAHDFIRDEIGELIGLKHWYSDSTYRYSVTDTLQPIIETSAAARRPPGNPKADRRRYLVLGHGSHMLDTARYLGGPLEAIRARLSTKADTYCWFLEVAYANGCLGQLDLTIAVRMDWWEGFQVYGSEGSVIGKLFNPWYLRAAEVQAFSVRDDQYHQPIGEDANVFRLQIEDLVNAATAGAILRGATAEDGLASVQAMVALSQSVTTGDWVKLADVTGGLA